MTICNSYIIYSLLYYATDSLIYLMLYRFLHQALALQTISFKKYNKYKYKYKKKTKKNLTDLEFLLNRLHENGDPLEFVCLVLYLEKVENILGF
jgi:hypothetical protein